MSNKRTETKHHKPSTGLRLSNDLLAAIDTMAHKEQRKRSNMMAILLAEATQARQETAQNKA